MNPFRSLRFKIPALFVVLMLIGNGASLITANMHVTRRYAEYTTRGDRQRATLVAGILQQSWTQWQESNFSNLDVISLEEKRPRIGMMLNRPGSEHAPIRSDAIHIAVINPKGSIIYSSVPPQLREPINNFRDGEPIVVEEEVVGYVLAGSMVNQRMNPDDQLMLTTINRTLIISILISTLIILTLGVILLGRLLSPLKNITGAAKRLATGDYSARSNVKGDDEIGELALQFDEMAHSIEGAEEWKRRIIADTAHELRTPAALLLSRLEMMKDGIYPTDENQLDSLYQVAQNFSHLIGDMQKLAGMEGGTVTLEKESGDLISFCQSQVQLFSPEAHKKSIELKITHRGEQKEKIDISLDWNKIDQVLKNLLSNALRHTPEAGKVHINLNKTDSKISICVNDSGPGIPPKERIQIFDRFYKLDKSRNRKSGGYGLGLAISRAISEAHGGRIFAEKSSLGGASFCVELPLE